MEDKEKKELVEAYKAIIDRKDKEIEKLKEEALLLMKTSLKRSEELEQVKDIVIRLRKRKELESKEK